MSSSTPDIFFDFEHFTLDQLVRIVPVAATLPLGDMQFTLLSLECYRDGFAALVLIEQELVFSELQPKRADYVAPLILRSSFAIDDAFDDRSGRYVGRPRAGSSSDAGPDRIGLRFVYSFTPALDPAAQILSLVVTQVGDLASNDDRPPSLITLGGPWMLSFMLPSVQEQAP